MLSSSVHRASLDQPRTNDDNNDDNDNTNNNKEEETVDFFRVFDLPYEFAINEQILREKYRAFMKDLHPDQQQQHQQRPNTTISKSSRNSTNQPHDDASAVTRAYDALKRPHVRAMHLLKLLGHAIEEQEPSASSNSSTTQQHHHHPQQPLVGACFLMDVMMQQEEVQEARHDQLALKRLYDRNVTRLEECVKQLETAFAEQDWGAARTGTAQLQYWNRLDETLREALDTLD